MVLPDFSDAAMPQAHGAVSSSHPTTRAMGTAGALIAERDAGLREENCIFKAFLIWAQKTVTPK